MKALVQEGYGSADVLHLREIPRPELMEGRVLIRMRAASVNALDWHTTHGGLLLDVISKLLRRPHDPVRDGDVARVIRHGGPGSAGCRRGEVVRRGRAQRLRDGALGVEE